ncbi:DUF4251 domain-containing protein [Flavobacterium limnophilum]|uniref:DUF4251 domain-containing protein n=1 Tax=Flavobacterium limnophilum TaxID=3003262 RepID=UPI0022ABEE03|nr:DUF4251 domain-containing protein [Flavobacterium limnophilum]
MKTKFNYGLIRFLMLVLITFSFSNASAQEKTKKQLKEEAKLEKQKKVALLVDSKEFVFSPRSVSPQGGRSITLTDVSYSMEFHPDLIKSYLPFFGRGYGGIGYGGDSGMDFEGKPTVYTIEKTKKSYLIKAEVKGERDSYSIMLSVYFEGNAYLSINSNNRSSISYDGDIKAIEKK